MRAEKNDRPDLPASDVQEPADEQFALVYGELRHLAIHYINGERQGHSLQPTELVHEAYLRLSGHPNLTLRGGSHALALAARAMRRILIDHARHKRAAKRDGSRRPWLILDEMLSVATPDEYVDLDRALDALAELDPREAQIIELHFFGGLTTAEIAELVGVTDRMIRYELAHARAWLKKQLG